MQMRKEMEQKQEEAWASQQAANLRAAQLLEEERERQHKVMAQRVRVENESKAAQDHATYASLKNFRYKLGLNTEITMLP